MALAFVILAAPLVWNALMPRYLTLSGFKGFDNANAIWSAEEFGMNTSLFEPDKITYDTDSFAARVKGRRDYALQATLRALAYNPYAWESTKPYYQNGAAIDTDAIDDYAAEQRDWILFLSADPDFSAETRKILLFGLAKFNVDYLSDPMRFPSSDHPKLDEGVSLKVGVEEIDRLTASVVSGQSGLSGEADPQRDYALLTILRQSDLLEYVPIVNLYGAMKDNLQAYARDDSWMDMLKRFADYCYEQNQLGEDLSAAIVYAHFSGTLPSLNAMKHPLHMEMSASTAALLRNYYDLEKLPNAYRISEDEYIYSALAAGQNLRAVLNRPEDANLAERFAAYCFAQDKVGAELSRGLQSVYYLNRFPSLKTFSTAKLTDICDEALTALTPYDDLSKLPQAYLISEDAYMNAVLSENVAQALPYPELTAQIDRYAAAAFAEGTAGGALTAAVWASRYLGFPALARAHLSDGQFRLDDGTALCPETREALAKYWNLLPPDFEQTDLFHYGGFSAEDLKETLAYADFFASTRPKSIFMLVSPSHPSNIDGYAVNTDAFAISLQNQNAGLVRNTDLRTSDYCVLAALRYDEDGQYQYEGYDKYTTGYSITVEIEIYPVLTGEVQRYAKTIHPEPNVRVDPGDIPAVHVMPPDYSEIAAFFAAIGLG
ncbi:MAG: hypothetical protein LBT44_02715 [Clostridiales bacterium]|nr:hypothetical protein [Clostridiales bacterium]